MNRQQLYILSGVLLATVALSGCAASQVNAALASLKDDKADACIAVQTSVAGYAGTATACRSNSDGGTVSVDKNGNVSITRGGVTTASAPPATTTAKTTP